MLVRGISDTPWHPAAYDSVLASRRAAKVVVDVITHLPGRISKAPVTFGDLSPQTNARTAGYLIACQAWFSVGPVTKVTFTAGGRTRTSGRALARLEKEYTYGASRIGVPG